MRTGNCARHQSSGGGNPPQVSMRPVRTGNCALPLHLTDFKELLGAFRYPSAIWGRFVGAALLPMSLHATKWRLFQPLVHFVTPLRRSLNDNARSRKRLGQPQAEDLACILATQGPMSTLSSRAFMILRSSSTSALFSPAPSRSRNAENWCHAPCASGRSRPALARARRDTYL